MKEKSMRGERGKKRVRGFQVVENECIWMKAGVVNFKLCDNAYDCYNCPFDRGLRRAMGVKSLSKSGEISAAAWGDKLAKRYQGSSRPCRHFLTGRINAPKICTMNYECYHCPFDQVLDAMELVEPAGKPTYTTASGYRLADGYYYHLGHSWARIEHGGRVRVGFDDFLVKVLGSAQHLDLPALGANLKLGEPGWILERDDHQAQVLSPVSGKVLAVNQKAKEHPEISHEDPYQEGWLFILEPDMLRGNLKGLYFGEESIRWTENETQLLLELMGPQYAQLASTGGEPVNDLFGQFPEIGWDRLVQTFLRT